MGNKMAYNSDHLNQTTGKIGQASTKAQDAQNLASNGFQGMSSLFGSGIGEISKQLGSLQGSLSNVQGIMTRQTEAMFNMDAALAAAADAIEVPQDFVKNESNRFTEYHDMLLEKLDGRAVTDGQDPDVKENLADSQIGSSERLGDITTGTEAKEEKYDATSSIGSEKTLGDITGNGGLGQSSYNGNSSIGQEAALGNITGGILSEQELRDQSRINAQEALANMNTAGGVNVQTLQDITGTLANVDNINNGQETEMVSLEFNPESVQDTMGVVTKTLEEMPSQNTVPTVPLTTGSTLGDVTQIAVDTLDEDKK